MIIKHFMTKRRVKNPGNLNNPEPRHALARAHFTSEPLRREAERGWEESDRSTAKGVQRRNNKARAHKLRRQSAREKDQLIARLTQKVARLEAELAKHLKRRQEN